MNVLMVGGLKEAESLWCIAEGFRKCGHKVDYLSSVVRMEKGVKLERAGLRSEIEEHLKTADLLFWWCPKAGCDPAFVKALHRKHPSIPMVYYSFDDPGHLEYYPKQPEAFRFAVTCCEGSLPWYEKQGIIATVLYPPADEDLHGKAEPTMKERCDISFAANSTYPREKCPHVLTDRATMVRTVSDLGTIHLYGPWTETPNGWGNATTGLSEMESCYRGTKSYLKMPGIFAASRINLCSHFRPDGYRYLNERVITCMASGGFLLTDKVAGIEGIFTEGVHLDTWTTIAELKAKAKWWLEHESERHATAQVGRQHVLNKFSNTEFAKAVMEMCSK